jgi:hypothetical protein
MMAMINKYIYISHYIFTYYVDIHCCLFYARTYFKRELF